MALKLSEVSSALASVITDANTLNAAYRQVMHALDNLQSELAKGYRSLDVSRELHEQQHAKQCSEARANVLSILNKLQLFSTYLPKLRSSGIPVVQSFFHEFSQVLNGEHKDQVIPFIIASFRSRADQVVTLMTTQLSSLQIQEETIKSPMNILISIER